MVRSCNIWSFIYSFAKIKIVAEDNTENNFPWEVDKINSEAQRNYAITSQNLIISLILPALYSVSYKIQNLLPTFDVVRNCDF